MSQFAEGAIYRPKLHLIASTVGEDGFTYTVALPFMGGGIPGHYVSRLEQFQAAHVAKLEAEEAMLAEQAQGH